MDLLYLVRKGEVNEDLRASLRSIHKFAPPFDKIFFVGDCPDWCNNIEHIYTEQYNTSWKNAFNNLIIACQDDRLSNDFILMNDDFIATRSIDNWNESLLKAKNTISQQIINYQNEGINSNYTKAFVKTIELFNNIELYNYELHIPMIINKKKFLDLFNKPELQEFIKTNPVVLYRSIYGNYYGSKFNELIDDVKFEHGDPFEITTEWISVFDNWVGNREKYPRLNKFLDNIISEPSKYERRIVKIFDNNTHNEWSKLYKQRHESIGRTNGGYTYSKDIVEFHIPIIIEILKKSKYQNIAITTVGMPENIINNNTDLVICYLHEELSREQPRCLKFRKIYNKDIIYICSRKDVFNQLSALGFKCVFIPMSINTNELKQYKIPESEKYQDNRVLYFGNKYLGKGALFNKTKQAFLDKGWIFDEISNSLFNNSGNPLTRDEIFNIIAKYKYGVAGGRCALEMNCLDVKTLICLESNQGIWTTQEEFNLHIDDNFAGKELWTFSPEIDTSINNFDKAILRTIDVQDVLPILKKQLKDKLL